MRTQNGHKGVCRGVLRADAARAQARHQRGQQAGLRPATVCSPLYQPKRKTPSTPGGANYMNMEPESSNGLDMPGCAPPRCAFEDIDH